MTDPFSYQQVTAMSSGQEQDDENLKAQTKKIIFSRNLRVTRTPVMLKDPDTSSSDTDSSDTNSSDTESSDSSYSLLDAYSGSSFTKIIPWKTTSQKRILMLDKEKKFTRLAIMLNDIVPKAVREFFNEHVSRSKLLSSLEDPKISLILEKKLKKDVLKLNYLDLNSRLRLLLKTQLGELISSEERAALNVISDFRNEFSHLESTKIKNKDFSKKWKKLRQAVITISGRKFRKKMSTLHDISGMALSEQQGSEAEDKYREFPEMSKTFIWMRQHFSFLVSEIEWTAVKSCLLTKRSSIALSLLNDIEQNVKYRQQRVERLLLEVLSSSPFSAVAVELIPALRVTSSVCNEMQTLSGWKQNQLFSTDLDIHVHVQHTCTKCSKATFLKFLSVCDGIPEDVYYELLQNGHLGAKEVLKILKCSNNKDQVKEFLLIISHRSFNFKHFVAAVLSVAKQQKLLNLTKIIESLKGMLCNELKISFEMEKPKEESEVEKMKNTEETFSVRDNLEEEKEVFITLGNQETVPKEHSDNIFAIVTIHAGKGTDNKLLEKILQCKESINKDILEYGQITDAWLGTVDIVIQLSGKSGQNVPKLCIDKIVQQILENKEIKQVIQTLDTNMDLKINIKNDAVDGDENDFQKKKLALRKHFRYMKQCLFVGSFIAEFEGNGIMNRERFENKFQFGKGGSLETSAQKFIEFIIKSDSKKVMDAFFKVLNEDINYRDISKKLTDSVEQFTISEMFEYGLKPECSNMKGEVSDTAHSDQKDDNASKEQTCIHSVHTGTTVNEQMHAPVEAPCETDIVPLHSTIVPFQNNTGVPISVKIYQTVNINYKKQATVIGSKGVNIQLGSDDQPTQNENVVAVGGGEKSLVWYNKDGIFAKGEDEDSDSEISGDDDNVDWGNDRKAGGIVGDVSKSDDADSGDDICIGGCEEDCSNESRDDSGNENGYKAYTNNVCMGENVGNIDNICSDVSEKSQSNEGRDDSGIENGCCSYTYDESRGDYTDNRDTCTSCSHGFGGDQSNEKSYGIGSEQSYNKYSGDRSSVDQVCSRNDICIGGVGCAGDQSNKEKIMVAM